MDVYKTGNAVLPLSEVTFVLCVRPALLEGGPYRCGSLFEILYYFCSSSIAHDYVSVIQGGTSPHVDMLSNRFFIQHNHTTFRPSAPPPKKSWPIIKPYNQNNQTSGLAFERLKPFNVG